MTMTDGDPSIPGGSGSAESFSRLVGRLANELYRDGFAGAADMPGVPHAAAALDGRQAEAARGHTPPPLPLPLGGFDVPCPTSDVSIHGGLRPGRNTAGPRFYFLDDQPQTTTGRPRTPSMFPVEDVRRDFPALHQSVRGRPLVWMDSAATTHKPQRVIDAVSDFYARDNSNVHRGAHTLAVRATEAYEGARETVQAWVGAGSSDEIVFVRGTTEGINLVAQTHGRVNVGPGDEIVVTELEHHANIVPWQMVAAERQAVLRVAPVTDAGEVDLEAYERLLGPRTRIVALSQASNVLGTVLPLRLMTSLAHAHGARVLVDGAQGVPHMPVDVQEIGCDFYTFSGHKIFGPTGIGALYGRRELLEAMPPWQGGGNMIDQVTFERTTYNDIPHRFEAGTGMLAQAVGLAAALDYLRDIGPDAAMAHEQELLRRATDALLAVPGLRLIGTARAKVAVLSFVLEGISSEDVAARLDAEGIAVRAGHHCAQPTMQRFGVPGTVRASLAFYNTLDEIEALASALHRIAPRPTGPRRWSA